MWKSCLSLPVYPSHCLRWCDPKMLFVIHQNIKSTEPEITSLKLSLWIKAMGRWSFSARILKIILLSPAAPGWLITDPALLVPPSSGLQTTASCHPAMFSLIHLKHRNQVVNIGRWSRYNSRPYNTLHTGGLFPRNVSITSPRLPTPPADWPWSFDH